MHLPSHVLLEGEFPSDHLVAVAVAVAVAEADLVED